MNALSTDSSCRHDASVWCWLRSQKFTVDWAETVVPLLVVKVAVSVREQFAPPVELSVTVTVKVFVAQPLTRSDSRMIHGEEDRLLLRLKPAQVLVPKASVTLAVASILLMVGVKPTVLGEDPLTWPPEWLLTVTVTTTRY